MPHTFKSPWTRNAGLSFSRRERPSDIGSQIWKATVTTTIACECVQHHLHVNDDWILIEPVDGDNEPVPDGVQSDKLLLTNLFNFTQPFIRYELTDRVVMHHEPCACGNPLPWLTLEGRTDDVVSLIENGEEVRVAPVSARSSRGQQNRAENRADTRYGSKRGL